ncbi:serine hydrolase [Chitinophaga deserti]|uniref:serine hydrolase n=1 Tax=Chitinophaga deserti TaxID=2164099 RepID=UPI000D6AD2AB|nr:serine hydrolase [Chitinophaga deserti]
MMIHIPSAGKALQTIVLFVCLISGTRPVFSQQPSIPAGDLSAQLDQYMKACHTTGLFNGSVLISVEGKTLLAKGYGYSNITSGALNTAATKYPIYSITKSMTAVLVMQLIEKKLLTPDDRLSRFYPSLPAADSITIGHLLSHTSGIYPYNNDYSMPTQSEEEMIRFLSGRRPGFRSGSQWQYSNTGYYLLGFIIEKLTGLPYDKALDAGIFRPLKMKESGLDFRELKSANKATGYRLLYPGLGKEARLYPQEELRSSGGVWSTVGDLLKFHEGMQAYRIISEAGTRVAYSVNHNSYGYGWFIETVNGKQVVSHSGGAAGFRSLLVRMPESNTCIVLLANAENFDLPVIKEGIMQLLSGKSIPMPANEKVDADRLQAIAGTYQLEPDRWLYISRVQQRLVAQISGQQPVLLMAGSSGRFHVAGTDAYLEFTGEKAGVYDTVLLNRKGRRHVGIKTNAGWGIAGSALPGGWSGPDVPMLPVNGKHSSWTASNIQLQDGVIKFRFNNDWTINYGAAPGGKGLEENGADIQVIAGRYTITLDLEAGESPIFRMQKE